MYNEIRISRYNRNMIDSIYYYSRMPVKRKIRSLVVGDNYRTTTYVFAQGVWVTAHIKETRKCIIE